MMKLDTFATTSLPKSTKRLNNNLFYFSFKTEHFEKEILYYTSTYRKWVIFEVTLKQNNGTVSIPLMETSKNNTKLQNSRRKISCAQNNKILKCSDVENSDSVE